MSLDDVPAFLETFTGAVQSACWFWTKENLNSYADSQDIATMTRRINGGTLGLEDRLNKYNNFLSILS
jgi:putative chitinase